MKLSRDAQFLLRKIAIYFIIIFAAALLQTSFLATLAPFGAVPDLMMLLAVGVGYFCAPAKGGVFGLAAGVVTYALGGLGFAALPFLYGAAGYLAGVVAKNLFKGNFVVWCLYAALGALFKAVYSLFCCAVFSGEFQLWVVLGHTVLPEFVGTILLGAALCVPIKKICTVL